MNLGQAYQGWQQQSQNRELYMKTREAFRKAWFTLPTNRPCSYYTKEVLGTALAETREIESNKAKAASVMCHVLAWAHWAEPKFNPEPDFTYNDLMEYTKGPLADPDKIAIKRDQDPTDIPANTRPDDEPLVRVKSEALAKRKAELEARNDPKEEANMEEKKLRGKQPRKICQIDPITYQVVKTYDSCSAGCKAANVKNIDRAIKRLQLAGGYYWQYPEDVPTFAERITVKKNAKPQQKPKAEKKPESLVDKFNEEYQAFVQMKRDGAVPAVKPSPADHQQSHNAARDALEVFTDNELIAELDRRGWQGELRHVQVVSIGNHSKLT